MGEIVYPGDELELFAQAHRWRQYWTGQVGRFITGHTIEVGAGIGSLTKHIAHQVEFLTSVEPDPNLNLQLAQTVATERLANVNIVLGTLSDLDESACVDSIVYADVLEHIEADGEEVLAASRLLKTGGHLVVLVPAHQWLYSPFDAGVGHYRRYSRKRLLCLTPPGFRMVELKFLDATGLALSAANRLLLRSGMPNRSQVALWDRFFIKASKFADPLFGFRFGKSCVVVWRKD